MVPAEMAEGNPGTRGGLVTQTDDVTTARQQRKERGMAKETNGTGHQWPRWPWLVLTVAGVVVTAVAAIVGTVASSDSEGEEPPAATRVTVTATQFETRTITSTVTATPTRALPEFANGLFEIGTDVQPGTYRTDGPDGTNAGGCYWSRTSSTGDLIQNGVIQAPGTISVRPGERIDSTGCLPWRRAA
jgi:hypothetical protein